LEKYKELLHPLSCLFVSVYLFLLIEATSESALDKLKREARDRKLERKVEASMKEKVEKKKRNKFV